MSIIYKRKCKTCGKYYEGRGKFFCSNKCKGISKRINPKKVSTQYELTKRYKKHIPLRVILNIKRGMKRWREENKDKINQYKREYYNKHFSLNAIGRKSKVGVWHTLHRGKLHPNWKGGKQRNKHNGDWKYIQWRKKVFEYDNYTCWICEIKGCSLEAHHLYSWSKYPELRFKANNGITLCKKCHKLYGGY